MHAKIENGTVIEYPIVNIRQALPDISLPYDLTDDSALPDGYVYVWGGAIPTYNQQTHKIVEEQPKYVANRWEVIYSVVPLNQDEIAEQNNRLQSQIVFATQQRLDDFARTRNYDGILSLCTYATSPTAKFATEGQYGVEARDATWAKLYEILAEVEAGTRPMPTGYADIEPELPVLAWPTA